MFVRAAGGLTAEVQAGEDPRGAAVGGLEQPDGAGVAAHADLVVGGGVSGVGADLEAADLLLPDAAAVADLDDDVDAAHEAVGDAGGAAALDHLVAEFGFAELGRRDGQPERFRGVAAVLDGGDGAVAGDPEVGAVQRPEAVVVDPIVVVGAGLDDGVADRPARAVEDVPVRQDQRGAVGAVVDDRTDGAGGDLDVADADAGADRVQASLGLGRCRLGFGDDPVRELVTALEHIRGHRYAVDLDRLRQQRGAQALERLGRHLPAHGELHRDGIGGLAVDDLVPDPHRRHVRVGEEVGGTGAHEPAQRLRGGRGRALGLLGRRCGGLPFVSGHNFNGRRERGMRLGENATGDLRRVQPAPIAHRRKRQNRRPGRIPTAGPGEEDQYLPKASATSWPPKPNELFSAYL